MAKNEERQKEADQRLDVVTRLLWYISGPEQEFNTRRWCEAYIVINQLTRSLAEVIYFSTMYLGALGGALYLYNNLPW